MAGLLPLRPRSLCALGGAFYVSGGTRTPERLDDGHESGSLVGINHCGMHCCCSSEQVVAAV